VSLVAAASAGDEEDEALALAASVRARFGAIAERGKVNNEGTGADFGVTEPTR